MKKETAYPIWYISAKWNQDGYENNCTGFRVSFRRHFSPQHMEKFAQKWWNKYIYRRDKIIDKKRLIDKNPKLIELKIEFLDNEMWYLTWFAHQSLNYFDNEKDAFENFKKWFLSKGYEFMEYDYRPDTHNDEIGCPMGADEEWRWKFCGCKICKRLGITIIKH